MANSPYLLDTNSQAPQDNQYFSGPASQPGDRFNDPNQSSVLGVSNNQSFPEVPFNGQKAGQDVVSTGSNGTALGSLSNWTPNTGFTGGWNGGNPIPPDQQGTGSVLGQIGSAPLGFDAAKWGDASQGTSNKYIVGRLAAQGVPIDQIAKQVGARVIAPDKIQYPDGFIADLYFDYGGPNQRVQYTDVTPYGDSGVLGQQQSGGLFDASSIQQLISAILGMGQQQTLQNQSQFQNRNQNLPGQSTSQFYGYSPLASRMDDKYAQ